MKGLGEGVEGTFRVYTRGVPAFLVLVVRILRVLLHFALAGSGSLVERLSFSSPLSVVAPQSLL